MSITLLRFQKECLVSSCWGVSGADIDGFLCLTCYSLANGLKHIVNLKCFLSGV